MKILLNYAVAWIFLFPSPGHSETALIGSEKISITIPRGYCPLADSDPSDLRLIRYLQEENRIVNLVLIIFADCEQLDSWRQGVKASLDDYGYILSPLSLANTKLRMSITNYLSEMREIMGGHSDTTPENQADRVEELVKKSFTTAKLNQTKNLGLLFEDDKALYWGLLQNIAAENGEIKNMLGFMGITLVKGKGVNIYLWKKCSRN